MPFKSLIREKCGLSFDGSREALLVEGVKARLAERSLASQREYFEILSREPEEFNRLVDLITVNETYFFREPAHFKMLTERLIPEAEGAGQGEGTTRIVSVGCSTGEEPYTIAIALSEKFGPAFSGRFSVVGFDIDETALNSAKRGLYSEHSFRGVPDRIREDYFVRSGQKYRIKDSVREGVQFFRLNIFEDDYPGDVCDADVIFYRNVSIYFDSETQQRIFTRLAGLLKEKGHLILSSTETFFYNLGVLSLIERDGIFLYSKGDMARVEDRRKIKSGGGGGEARKAPAGPGTPAVEPAPARLASEGKPGAGKHEASRKQDQARTVFDEALRLGERKQYDAALELIEKVVALDHSFIKAYLLKAGILINLKRFDEAEKACLASVGIDRFCLEGCLFLGLIAKVRGDVDEAKRRFKEALYVRPSCWVAHFFLGEVYRSGGDTERAKREFEIVIALVEGNDAAEHGLAFFTLYFSTEQITHLCRQTLAVMVEK